MRRLQPLGALPLAIKVGAVLAVAMLVLPLVGARWGAQHARTAVEAQVHSAQRALLAELLGRVEVAYESAISGAIAAAERPDLAMAVAGDDENAVATVLSDIRRLESYAAVRAYDEAGLLLAADPPHQHETDQLRAASDVEVSPPTQGPAGVVLVIRAALRNGSGVVGHLAAHVSFPLLAGGIDGMRPANGIDLTLVDRAGVILASPLGPESEGTSLRAPEARALVAAGRAATDTYVAPRLGEVVSTFHPSVRPWQAIATTPRALALAEADDVERSLWRGGLLLAGLLLVTGGLVATYVGAAERRLRLAREELMDHNRFLESANAELDTYAHMVAHDLKNPLSTIGGFITVAEQTDGARLSPTGREALDTIGHHVRRLFGIIDGLLAYARAGASDLRLDQVELTGLVEDVVEQLSATIRERGAEVRVGPLPVASVDPVLMAQVFQNLIENGVQYGDREHPVVAVLDASDEHTVRISVHDNGEGVAPSDSERVFEMFGRGSAGVTRQGSGIGLALAHRIVERHNGALRLGGAGTPGGTFLIELPVAASDPA